jgi:hypothetical protein
MIELEAAIYSKYLWRGVNRVDDFVFQAGASASILGIKGSLWGNLDLTNENDRQYEFTQVDAVLGYGLELGPVALEAGVIGYFYPNERGDTAEIYASIGVDTLLSPKLSIYRDIDEVDGIYANLEITYRLGGLFNMTDKVGLSPAITASLGYGDSKHNEAYYGVDESAFADVNLGFIVPWSVLDTVTVWGGVYYSGLINSDARDRASDPSNFFVGIGASLKL